MSIETAAINCEDVVRAYLEHLDAGFSCAQRDGLLWIVSPFQYPNCDYIEEVALRQVPTGGVVISDLGETLRHLADLGYDPRATPKSEYLLGEALKQHNVELRRGTITKRTTAEQVGLGGAVYDIIAACLAVSHLL